MPSVPLKGNTKTDYWSFIIIQLSSGRSGQSVYEIFNGHGLDQFAGLFFFFLNRVPFLSFRVVLEHQSVFGGCF